MFRVLGEKGFIGSHLKQYISSKGHTVVPTPRDILSLPTDKNLGHVIYCIGLTADFRTRPYATIDAHVSLLSQFLERYHFDSFLYLSSARVYQENTATDEDTAVKVNPNHPEDLYNISKLLGESVCKNSKKRNIRVARLSNIFSEDMPKENFLFDITQNMVIEKSLHLRSSLSSAKDYLSIDQAVELLYKISLNGQSFIYNVASGYNTSTKEIIDLLNENYSFEVLTNDNAKEICFPEISIEKIKQEFMFSPPDFSKSYLNFASNISSKQEEQ